jgi:hypothetical protein
VSIKKPSKPRALDALVGTGIAAVVIVAATFGELGPAHRAPQAVAYGGMQPVRHHPFKAKAVYPKARCTPAPCPH